MAWCARTLLFVWLLLATWPGHAAADARFDLLGPKIDVRVTRGAETLPIASVPNLQTGDKLWLHPDLPATQAVKYLLICVFLRGTTNPPPDSWFTRIETWSKNVRAEGAFVTVPPDAQQAVLFLAPETGGDFSTLRSAVQGRPGVFVRASQDLAEAGFEQARIEKYLASIRRVPPSDIESLQKHSDLLARTLALKPNSDCFKRPIDTQFTCLTQTGSQTLLDDGHGQSIVQSLSSGANSDFIAAASYTALAGGGLYSAYVGAVVDLIRIMGNLHTAQYQYIPAIAFPQGEAMNLRLNTPPSFHNPKSVLVIGLPSVQAATAPPLRPADATDVACLLKPAVVLPIEGAPLVFSTALAHNLRLHLNTPPGTPAEPDIPLVPDAYQGGLILQRTPMHHIPLHEPKPLLSNGTEAALSAKPVPAASTPPTAPAAESSMTTGTILGEWGFDAFTGPTISLQQAPGTDWHLVSADNASGTPEIIAGHTGEVLLTSTGSACVHTIAAQPAESSSEIPVTFRRAGKADHPNLLTLSLPSGQEVRPGDLHLLIQQFGQPKADLLAARTFKRAAHVTAADLHAGDKTLLLRGTDLGEIDSLKLGDLVFKPVNRIPEDTAADPGTASLHFALPADAPAPPTHADDHLTAIVTLKDGRLLSIPLTVSASRPALNLLSKSTEPASESGIALSSGDDLPLRSRLTFTLKSKTTFPRNGEVEVETVDGTLRTVLTLAPSGGLLLQDPHTIVATLDPLRSFGPSAFGSLHVRAIFPARLTSGRPQVAPAHDDTPAAPASGTDSAAASDTPDTDASVSDWLPLGTLVRLPTLAHIQCPADPAQPCILTGANLFLLESLAADPSFTAPLAVPDGFTGTSIAVPHVNGTTFFLKLRDDPAAVAAATVALTTTSTTAATVHKTGHS